MVQVALHDVQGAVAAVRHVPLIELGEHPTPLDLQDALPLDDFLASVGDYKEAITSAVESLQPAQEGSDAVAGCRGFGPALQASAPACATTCAT